MEELTEPELRFIRNAFEKPRRSLDAHGALIVPRESWAEEAWGTLSERVWEPAGCQAMREFVSAWRRQLGRALPDWFDGASGTEIARAVDVHPARPGQWRRGDGIPIDPLLRALYLTGRWGEPLPHPTSALVRRLVLTPAMHLFDRFFREAGVVQTPCPATRSACQVELFQQVLGRAGEWGGAAGRAATASDRVAACWPLAKVTIESAAGALTADGIDDDAQALRAWGDGADREARKRAVAECLRLWGDYDAFTAYSWAVSAIEDGPLLLPDR